MDDNSDEYSYFKKIGWNLKNIESQFNKVNNYSLGYFKANFYLYQKTKEENKLRQNY